MAITKTAGTAQSPRVDQKRQFYFLHGDDEAAIERFKNDIVTSLLSPDEREENYREILAPGTQPSLRRVLGELLAELSTVSFLPDTRRVVTLYPVADFFQARSAKAKSRKKGPQAEEAGATSSDHLAAFVSKELPNLPAVLICIAFEDYEKFKRIAAQNPIVALATQTGGLYSFKDASPQFAFFDALFARKSSEALTLWRSWVERTGNAPKPYVQLASQMRLLLQAKTASSGQLQSRGMQKTQYASDFMPAEADKNLYALKPEWRQDKLLRAAANFSFAELLSAYQRLRDLQKFAIPLNSDPFVPDKPLLAELWILEFTAGRA